MTTTVKCYFTLTGVAIIKKFKATILGKNVKKSRTCMQYQWECKIVQPFGKTVWPHLKNLNMVTIWLTVPLMGTYLRQVKTYVHKKTCTQISKAALFIQKVETIQIPIYGWCIKNVLYPYNKILIQQLK